LNELRVPNFWQALFCFGGVLTIIVAGVIKFGVNIHVLLILSIIWTSFHSYLLGYKFKHIKQLMSDGISKGLGAAYVFILIGIEYFFKYKKGVSQMDRLPRDVTSSMMHVFVTGTIGRMLFVPAILFIPETFFGRTLFFASPADVGPYWLQIIIAVLVLSFMRYSVHYFQHKIPFLWELHSYHHSITDLKAINTLVSHPFDYALRNVLPPVILASVGFDTSVIIIGTVFIGVMAGMSHCGAGLHAGWLNKWFVTPEVHRWHHSVVVPDGHKYAVNFGVGFILWDRLFGTCYLSMENGIPLQPDRLGHPSGYKDETNYFKLLFLTRYWPKFGSKNKEVKDA